MLAQGIYLSTVVIYAATGLLLIVAAHSWWKFARDGQIVSRSSFRDAAIKTAASLALLGVTLLWAAAAALLMRN